MRLLEQFSPLAAQLLIRGTGLLARKQRYWCFVAPSVPAGKTGGKTGGTCAPLHLIGFKTLESSGPAFKLRLAAASLDFKNKHTAVLVSIPDLLEPSVCGQSNTRENAHPLLL